MKKAFHCFTLLAFLTACEPDIHDKRVAPELNLELSSPNLEGMDPELLEQARAYAFETAQNTQSVLILRKGRLVAEWYRDGYDKDSLVTSWSIGKSMASALIGIAIDRGEIESVDMELKEFFPEWNNGSLENTTLRDLLEMRSGLAWNENEQAGSLVSETVNQLEAVKNRMREHPVGEVFNYSSADSMLLSQVIERSTGQSFASYANTHLWEPIGAQMDWWRDAQDNYLTYCCVDGTARDFAKFGQLFSNKGVFGGKRVVPEEWVMESTSPAPGLDSYGLHWWTNKGGSIAEGAPETMFAAIGYHKQFIYILPEQELVVVRNGIYHRTSEEAVADPAVGIQTWGDPQWDSSSLILPILNSIPSGS